jgi:hypothetical protein
MELELSPQGIQTQRQDARLTPSMEYRMWRDNPLGQLGDTQTVKHLTALNGAEYGSFNPVWKRIRRKILGGIAGRSVNVGIVGNSVSGKSELAQALLELAERDAYLRSEINKSGISLVPMTMPFALAAKAMQLPKEQGGPGLISNETGHGKFTEEEYRKISTAMQFAFNISTASAEPGVVRFHIMEGSGLPFIERPGYPVEISGMSDRGVSPIYNLAYHPEQAKNSFILLMAPNKAVQEFGLTERTFEPSAKSQQEMVNGRMLYTVTKGGRTYDAADLPAEQQRAIAELLLMSMAPAAAVERSNGQYEEMKYKLVDEGRINDSSNETYMEVQKQRLLALPNGRRTNIDPENVIVVENKFWEGFRNPSSNVRNLDYLLRSCGWSQRYPELIPEPLREFLDNNPVARRRL